MAWCDAAVANGTLTPPDGPQGWRVFRLFLVAARNQFEDEEDAALAASDAARAAAVADIEEE